MSELALTKSEQAQLAQIEQEELAQSAEGIQIQPVRYKINKDTQQFVDPFGQAHDELRGVIVYKEIARGHWQEGDNVPLCTSIGGAVGADRENHKHDCAKCQFNEWGSGKGGSGKACKEMRRIYLVQRGGFLPLMISLSPTSIKLFDAYISGRIQQRIPDIMAETVFKLVPDKSDQGNFVYAVIKCQLGARITDVGELMELRSIREKMRQAAAQMAVSDADYSTEQPGVAPAEAPQAGDVF